MNEKNAIFEKITAEPCAVVGVGVSNLPLIDMLLSHGAKVVAYDEKRENELHPSCRDLQKKGVSFVCGEGAFDKIKENIIFRSPGVRPDKGALASAGARGAVVICEMELFFELSPAKKYVITGSDGKTTTTTLTHLFLSAQRKREGARAFVGGNIGEPLLPKVSEMTERDAAVIELSSFQLMGNWCESDAVAITNVTPNHLNWHTDMNEYVSAKMGAVGTRTKRVVLNADNEICASFDFGERDYIYFSSTKKSYAEIVGAKKASAVFLRDGKVIFSSGKEEKEILSTDDVKLPGRHNLENYMTAIALTFGEVDFDIYRQTARSFGGVEHRLELVCELDGVKYYNSSIDSSPTRTAAALSALPQKPVVICGGSEKGLDFAPLAKTLLDGAKAVVLNGASRQKIKAAIDAELLCGKAPVGVFEEETLGDALARAREIADRGDIVLLSPACASFDQFKNFAERGEFFKNTVLSWKKDEN